jgi:hypothetical protein
VKYVVLPVKVPVFVFDSLPGSVLPPVPPGPRFINGHGGRGTTRGVELP